jgi:Transposase, Mutator family
MPPRELTMAKTQSPSCSKTGSTSPHTGPYSKFQTVLDQLLQGLEAKDAFGRDGLVDALKKALAERALNAELDHHLAAGEADGRGNSRNGFGAKTVFTDTGNLWCVAGVQFLTCVGAPEARN